MPLRYPTYSLPQVKLKEVDPDTFSRLTARRPSATMMAPKSRPLAEKLDKFLRMLIGRIAILYKGTLVVGSNTVKFHKYITPAQLQELKF